LIAFNGLIQTLSAWVEETGIPQSTIINRLDRLGWSISDTLSIKVDARYSK
jgi:hypothetical protein